jgi:hypothetical protein
VIDERLKELAAVRMRQADETLREARILSGEHTGRGAAFEHRQRADYGELTELDESTTAHVIEEADVFIQNVRTYMKTRGFTSLE